MILGWHREAQNFIEQHQDALRRVPVAYFMVALSLTEFTEKQYAGTPIYQDARLAKAPKNPAKLSFRENFTSVPSYAQPAFERAPQAAPVSIGFFGGKLDYGRLNLFQRLFVRLLIGAAPGDFRNWDAIREWSEDLLPALSREA
jgi:menaquinone-dependent protoporphyrinogen oxidase